MYYDLRDRIGGLKWEGIAMDFVTMFPRTSSGHDTIWVIVDRLTKSAHFLPMRKDYKMDKLARLCLNEIVARHGVPILIISDREICFTTRGSWDVHLPLVEFSYNNSYHSSVRCAPFEALYGRKCRLLTMRLRLEKKGVIRFGKKGKLAPRFVVPFEIIKKVGPVDDRLDLPEELDGVHDTFHVLNLKKCFANPTLQVPLDEIQVDAKLSFVGEPVEILEREFKKLKQSRIAIVKGFGSCPNIMLQLVGPLDNATNDEDPKCWLACCQIIRRGTGERVDRGGRGRGPRGGNDERIAELNGQGNDQGLGANVNENVRNVVVNGNQENVRNVVVNGNQIEKIESVRDMSGCSIDQKVKYTAGSFVGKALTWWNSQIRRLIRKVTVSMSWNDFKFMMIEEFCPSHEMQKLETELWNHVMVGAGHVTYADRFHELARNGSIKKVEKKGNVGEPSKHKNARDDNKRTRTRNDYATTTNPVGRENTGAWTKVIPRNVNLINVRNLTPARGACHECGSTDHLKPACPRLNRAQGSGGNRPNKVATNNEGIEPSELGFRYDIEIATGHGSFDVIIGERLEEKARILVSTKTIDKKQKEIVMVRDFPKVFLDDLSGLPPLWEIEFRIELIPRDVPLAKSPYHLAPFELVELLGQIKELQDKVSFDQAHCLGEHQFCL
nr:putative reverse transcriptase domain, ribonuclease H-like domain, aspartic peptidase domain protein [Tanacetum cinerariifolium]